MGESVGPVGADAAGGVLAVDGGIDLAAEKEGEAPVEAAFLVDGVGTGKAVGYPDGGVRGRLAAASPLAGGSKIIERPSKIARRA